MPEMKLFNKWSFEGVEVKDPGLKPYINLKPSIVPKSGGKFSKSKFHKSNMNIVERFANKLMVAGHKGKKHLITSGRNTGKSDTVYKIIEEVFEKLEKRTNENPIKIFVLAVENA
ncbi:MAG: 30S ribosomal protein S7, partial [Candidatus Aenigmatarchaeota archaeon]